MISALGEKKPKKSLPVTSRSLTLPNQAAVSLVLGETPSACGNVRALCPPQCLIGSIFAPQTSLDWPPGIWAASGASAGRCYVYEWRRYAKKIATHRAARRRLHGAEQF